MKEIRYDRQLRLWGDHGQTSIESSSVSVLGSSALATEIVKNLVLAGVQRVCIIDDAKVQITDLGQNFFLTMDDIGKLRAERAVSNLKELNPSVTCEYRALAQKDLCDDKNLRFLLSFSVVVAANTSILEGDYISDLAEHFYNHGIPFVYARVYGLLGTIRVSVKEHFIIDNHKENLQPDLRLDKPFEKLQEMVDDMPEICNLSMEEVKHTPYLLLYFRALALYRTKQNNLEDFPSTHEDRKQFIECLLSLRARDDNGIIDSENFDQGKAAALRSVKRTTIPISVMEILNDPKCGNAEVNQTFWLLSYGLQQFVKKHQVLPLSGSLPDMASDTQRYTKLARLYHEKSLQDAFEVLGYIREEEKRRGYAHGISEQECIQFCKKSSNIRLQRGSSLRGFKDLKPLLEEISHLEDNASPPPAVWLLLLFASLRFGLQKLRFPGECQNMPKNTDFDGLKQRVVWLIEENEGNVTEIISKISDDTFREMLRFANSEPHVISSLIGGITAQEIIKLATNQYVPLDTTFLFDGCTQNSATFKL